MNIDAKPTVYASIQFRSRLEASWAIFLDSFFMVKDWKYEPLFITLDAGQTYTPDFSVLTGLGKFYLEIKPVIPTLETVIELVYARMKLDAPLLLCFGDFYKAVPSIIKLDTVPSERGLKRWYQNIETHAESLYQLTLFHRCERAVIKTQTYRFDLGENKSVRQNSMEEFNQNFRRKKREKRKKL